MSGYGEPGHWVMVRPRREAVDQANAALDAIKAANGGTEPARLRDAYDVAPAAFASLIEALVQLGAEVDAEMIALAGIVDIGEVL